MEKRNKKRMFDLMLEKDNLKKTAKIMRIIRGVGIAAELAIFGWMLANLGPITLINSVAFWSGAIIFAIYGILCFEINSTVSKFIKPILKNEKNVDRDFEQLKLNLQGKVASKGIKIDGKSFKLNRVKKYTEITNLTYQTERENETGKKIVEFKECTNSKLGSEREFISVGDGKNGLIGIIEIPTHYKKVRQNTLTNDGYVTKTVPMHSFNWYGPDSLSEVPAEIVAKARRLNKIEQNKKKPRNGFCWNGRPLDIGGYSCCRRRKIR